MSEGLDNRIEKLAPSKPSDSTVHFFSWYPLCARREQDSTIKELLIALLLQRAVQYSD